MINLKINATQPYSGAIRARLWNGRESRFDSPYDFLWDTGASYSIIGTDYAEFLGIKLNDANRLTEDLITVGNPVPGWQVNLPIRFPTESANNPVASLCFNFTFMVVENFRDKIIGFTDLHINFATFQNPKKRNVNHLVLRPSGHHQGQNWKPGIKPNVLIA